MELFLRLGLSSNFTKGHSAYEQALCSHRWGSVMRAGMPAATAGSVEAVIEDIVRTDVEHWDERLSQHDVQQVRPHHACKPSRPHLS